MVVGVVAEMVVETVVEWLLSGCWTVVEWLLNGC